jgi:hypothetical protein
LNTAQVYAALRLRFCAPEWAIFFEVPSSTGGGRGYADAVAMNLYPSRGLEVHGFEVKVTRSDWQRELRDPAKAEPVFRYCDRWWLVVGDAAIVKPGELPPTWGLLVPNGNGLKIATEASRLESTPVDRPFFAALVRRACVPPESVVEAMVQTRVLRQVEKHRPVEREARERVQEQHRKLQAKVLAFEQASGISIGGDWGRRDRKPEHVGAAVKFILDGGLMSLDDTLEMMERQAAGLAETIKAVRAAAVAADTTGRHTVAPTGSGAPDA